MIFNNLSLAVKKKDRKEVNNSVAIEPNNPCLGAHENCANYIFEGNRKDYDSDYFRCSKEDLN